MYRSTTPTLIFNIKNPNFDMTTIDICHVTIEGFMGTPQIIIENPDIDTTNKKISVVLTQEQTKSFDVGNVKIQLKIKLNNGSVVCSPVITKDMNEILEEAIL